jgi:hypothetical protein
VSDASRIVADLLDLRRPGSGLRHVAPGIVVRRPDGTEHVGRAAVARLMAGVARTTRGTLRFTASSIADGGVGEVLVDARVRARRPGRAPLDLPMTLRFRLHGSRIVALEESTPDMEAWHAFWRR